MVLLVCSLCWWCLLFPWRQCKVGMMVKWRDYHFTMFQARELSFVTKWATFPVKMLQEGISEHSSHFVCMQISSNWIRLAKPFYPCSSQGQCKELFCLVQANPILFGTPYFTCSGLKYNSDDLPYSTNANFCPECRYLTNLQYRHCLLHQHMYYGNAIYYSLGSRHTSFSFHKVDSHFYTGHHEDTQMSQYRNLLLVMDSHT